MLCSWKVSLNFFDYTDTLRYLLTKRVNMNIETEFLINFKVAWQFTVLDLL